MEMGTNMDRVDERRIVPALTYLWKDDAMSDLRPISTEELKAPLGMHRIVKTTGEGQAQTHFLVNDHANLGVAFDDWRWHLEATRKERREDEFHFTIRNADGREVGILGIRIDEKECKAPTGKFRIVCIDTAYMPEGKPTYWLHSDRPDRKEAIDIALQNDNGPFTDMAVFDETGTPQRA